MKFNIKVTHTDVYEFDFDADSLEEALDYIAKNRVCNAFDDPSAYSGFTTSIHSEELTNIVVDDTTHLVVGEEINALWNEANDKSASCLPSNMWYHLIAQDIEGCYYSDPFKE